MIEALDRHAVCLYRLNEALAAIDNPFAVMNWMVSRPDAMRVIAEDICSWQDPLEDEIARGLDTVPESDRARLIVYPSHVTAKNSYVLEAWFFERLFRACCETKKPICRLLHLVNARRASTAAHRMVSLYRREETLSDGEYWLDHTKPWDGSAKSLADAFDFIDWRLQKGWPVTNEFRLGKEDQYCPKSRIGVIPCLLKKFGSTVSQNDAMRWGISNGYRSATLSEGLAHARLWPDVQRGSRVHLLSSQVADMGVRHVPVLDGRHTVRSLELVCHSAMVKQDHSVLYVRDIKAITTKPGHLAF
ncbi:MAG: hypothetical protein U0487_02965 [Patescibacteria group bacterium]